MYDVAAARDEATTHKEPEPAETPKESEPITTHAPPAITTTTTTPPVSEEQPSTTTATPVTEPEAEPSIAPATAPVENVTATAENAAAPRGMLQMLRLFHMTDVTCSVNIESGCVHRSTCCPHCNTSGKQILFQICIAYIEQYICQ